MPQSVQPMTNWFRCVWG